MDSRRNILEKSIILFYTNGYEGVTMRDIALAANTIPAEIYNYFAGKEEILEEIYKMFSEIIVSKRLEAEEYIPILEHGTSEEILNIFNFPLPEPIDINFYIVIIVFRRKSLDERAKDVYLQYSWEESMKYLEEVLTKGIEIGRLKMKYDEIDVFVRLIHSIREYSANMAAIIPNQVEWRRIETEMNKQLSTLLILNDDIKPNNTSDPDVDSNHIIREIINFDSLSVGKYHHYSRIFKQAGYYSLLNLTEEVIENVLDEIDMMYTYLNQNEAQLEPSAIMKKIATNEKIKKLEAEKNISITEEEVASILSEISDLAKQHERLCLIDNSRNWA